MSNQGFITLEAPGRFAPFYRSPPFFQLANPHKGARSAYFRPHLTAAVVAVQDLELGLSHRPTGITSTAMISALVLLFILKGPPSKGGNCPNQRPKKSILDTCDLWDIYPEWWGEMGWPTKRQLQLKTLFINELRTKRQFFPLKEPQVV